MKHLAQLLEAAVQEPGDGRFAAVQVLGQLGQRPALQVVQRHRLALVLGQLGQGPGQE